MFWIVHTNYCFLAEVEADPQPLAMRMAVERWPEHDGYLRAFSKEAVHRRQKQLEGEVDRRLERVAYHEAGHSVAGLHYGLDLVSDSTRPEVCLWSHEPTADRPSDLPK